MANAPDESADTSAAGGGSKHNTLYSKMFYWDGTKYAANSQIGANKVAGTTTAGCQGQVKGNGQ